MENQSFTTTIPVDQSPQEVFESVINVRGWWSENIEGDTAQLNDEFTYHYKDVHRCKMRLTEVDPGKKIAWLVLDNYFSFTSDKTEWIGTKVIFEITQQDDKTQLRFMHEGLVPAYECYNACVNGWNQYIQGSLLSLITTGKGQPNTRDTARTVYEVAAAFTQLAREGKWFEIQDQFFADDVSSIEPANSPWFKNARGKANVRKKGEEFMSRVEAVHSTSMTEPVIGGNHFAVGREADISVNGLGRIQINQVMLYEVKGGQIISEQFFY